MGKKKITTVHIDEKVLRLAKKEINNLSVFVENCLKAYLGLDDCDFNISSIDNELNIMKQSNLNIHLLSNKNEEEIVEKSYSAQEINNAWLSVWAEYRLHEICDVANLNRLSELTGRDEDYLIDLMDNLLMNCDRKQLLKCETFSGAENQYIRLENE